MPTYENFAITTIVSDILIHFSVICSNFIFITHAPVVRLVLDGLLLRLILRIQNVFVRCILFTYIVCHSITAKVLSNLFQLSVWKFSKQNCREMPIKILIIFSFSSEQLTLIIIEENCRLTPYEIKFKKSKFLIENAGHWSHHSWICPRNGLCSH